MVGRLEQWPRPARRIGRLVVAVAILLMVSAAGAATGAEPEYEFQTIAGADGVPLNVVTSGDRTARAIVFVHGIAQSYLAFENQYHSSLRNGHFLVSFDLRGHGSSGKPGDAQAYSDRKIWADDLDRVIRGLGLQRPLLVGWSYGTLVVLDYLRVHGTQRIGGIVLTGAYGGLTKPDATAPPPAPRFMQLRDDLAGTDLDRKWRAARAMAKYLTARPMPVEWIERAAAIALLLPQAAREGMYRHPADNSDLLPVLRAVPVLFLVGSADPSAPEAVGRKLLASLPRARLDVYPDVGHSVFLESPDRFNRDLRDFAASLALH